MAYQYLSQQILSNISARKFIFPSSRVQASEVLRDAGRESDDPRRVREPLHVVEVAALRPLPAGRVPGPRRAAKITKITIETMSKSWKTCQIRQHHISSSAKLWTARSGRIEVDLYPGLQSLSLKVVPLPDPRDIHCNRRFCVQEEEMMYDFFSWCACGHGDDSS